MATVSVVPNGNGSSSWGSYINIDEGTTSPNDGDIVSTSSAQSSTWYLLEDMPANFGEATAVTIKVRCRHTSSKGDFIDLNDVQLFQSDESTAITAAASLADSITMTTLSVSPSITGAITKTVWDGARVRVRSSVGSDGQCEISAIQLDITYNTANVVFDETGSGGATGGGSAHVETIYANLDAAGGATCDGSASASLIFALDIATGGATAGGESEALSGKFEIASGGAVVSGDGVFLVEFIPPVSGGVLSGGENINTQQMIETATGGVYAAGDASQSATYNLTTTGGASASGTSVVSLRQTPITSGGTTANGGSKKDYRINTTDLVVDGFWGDEGTDLAEHISDSGDTWTTSQFVLGLDSAVSIEANAFAVVDAGQDDYSVSVDVLLLTADCGIIIRYLNSLNYWAVIVDSSGGLRIIEVTAGSSSQKAFDVVPIGTGTLNVLVKDSTILATYAGVSIEATASTLLDKTFVGLWAENSSVEFANFLATVPIHSVTSSGGAVINGNASRSATYNITSTGGVKLSGFSFTNPFILEGMDGGCVVGGTADIVGEFFEEIATGGAVVSGENINTQRLIETATGGTVAGGEASTSQGYAVGTSGGALVGGEGFTSQGYQILTTGGAVAGGEAAITSDWKGTAALSCNTTIAANGRNLEGGVLYFDCVSTIAAAGSVTHNLMADGGAVVGGFTTENHAHNIAAAGGVIVSGGELATTLACIATLTANGAITIPETAAGGVLIGGTSDVEYVPFVETQEGSAILSCIATLAADGTVSQGSAAVLSCSATLAANGNVTNNLTPDGEVLVGGEGEALSIFAPASTGGVVVSGRAFVPSPGYLVCTANLTATGTVENSITSTVGAVIGGGADVGYVASGHSILLSEAALEGTANFSSAAQSFLECRAIMDALLEPVPKPLMLELFQFLNENNIRCYPIRLAENARFPCVSFGRVSMEHLYDLDGAIGLANARIQIDIWASKHREIKDLTEQLRLLLEGFSDDMGSVDVFNTEFEGGIDLEEPPDDATGKVIFHRALDFIFLHSTKKPVSV